MSYKPTFIRLPLQKMAGCPWNLLDDRGMRIAWCGTDNNHEKDGELIANDILNLVAIAEAASELLEKGNAKLAEKDAEIERLRKALEQYEAQPDQEYIWARLTPLAMEELAACLRERDARPPTGGEA